MGALFNQILISLRDLHRAVLAADQGKQTENQGNLTIISQILVLAGDCPNCGSL